MSEDFKLKTNLGQTSFTRFNQWYPPCFFSQKQKMAREGEKIRGEEAKNVIGMREKRENKVTEEQYFEACVPQGHFYEKTKKMF